MCAYSSRRSLDLFTHRKYVSGDSSLYIYYTGKGRKRRNFDYDYAKQKKKTISKDGLFSMCVYNKNVQYDAAAGVPMK